MPKNNVSKVLQKSISDLHDLQLQQQELREKFVKTDKSKVAIRERIKKELIELSKKVKKTEAEFDNLLNSEPEEYFDVFEKYEPKLRKIVRETLKEKFKEYSSIKK